MKKKEARITIQVPTEKLEKLFKVDIEEFFEDTPEDVIEFFSVEDDYTEIEMPAKAIYVRDIIELINKYR